MRRCSNSSAFSVNRRAASRGEVQGAMRIALVAGEPSGDDLGAGLIRALAERYPQARFEGIGGQHMRAAGLRSHYPLEDLSVMGLVEVIRHLPRLLHIRSALRRRWLADPPDAFVGIDAPDFNLGLAGALRSAGIPTVQYVSPTVWAWRAGRLRKIRRSVDRVLCIYPFEHAFYAEQDMDSRFVGHPLADEIPLEVDTEAARRALELTPRQRLVALLPGSRQSEVERLLPLCLEVASRLAAAHSDLVFGIPAATPSLEARIRAMLERSPTLPVRVTTGGARDMLAAADTALVASGTATLEAMLLGCPAVMAYRVNWLTAALARRTVRIPYFAMPNLMAGEMIMPEFVQEQATADRITPVLGELLQDPTQRARIREHFAMLHATLRRDASQEAAAAIAELLGHD